MSHRRTVEVERRVLLFCEVWNFKVKYDEFLSLSREDHRKHFHPSVEVKVFGRLQNTLVQSRVTYRTRGDSVSDSSHLSLYL